VRRFAVLDAPSNLGLRPTGVEKLAATLRSAGLVEALRAEYAGELPAPPYDPRRDPATALLNGEAIRDYTVRLADAVGPILDGGRFPIVLGGDCSILLGPLLALRRRGRAGLFFVDGHVDFYLPEQDAYGEVASMELALIAGRGPALLTDLAGLRPLAHDGDIVAFGSRDRELVAADGGQDIAEVSAIRVYDLAAARTPDSQTAAHQALSHLLRDDLPGFWIHLDADVLDDAIMPAVDYRMPGGLSFAELRDLLRIALATGRALGITITIYNPSLDPDKALGRAFVAAIVDGLSDPTAESSA
jgi:arginase